ncbi:PUA domain (predicted RNA-binding domain) [Serratia quinivorans]|uniref:phosphoadenosine phosphosulfate reductase domain-containing protein n=1 Tax=Serratia quinivorans TaxID=137545 RepID=UPI002178DB94|nr:phosphoadenosine phosphosulfate reductase family protein [Serratia quinivorans]CAI0908380.1 PUA domain (predicted RNA-binding domain) [Serratia quinivorans]CAI0926128.1 PUA domain (predicted RNA-binding domain) [Serratia quinivorans]CAI1715086.1 PUA domain (predicted RNA-binding domain) [Serratia quinivorans]CAI2089866.1 PUA domain (predicted RNA-binding domain) [Serratia quinivorans]CAI2455133.1 PUA domain (predicted RNA-binding domain) [Serratia quinivorans]
MSKQKLLVLFSGGLTSAFMTRRLLNEYADDYEMIVVFANTGQENDETLDFVHACDVNFGFNTVWIEAVVHPGRIATTHRIVTYESAMRFGEPFEEIVRKYGIPNHSYPHCTRELKENPIHSYVRSIGWGKGDYLTAIGIRTDEQRRVKRSISKQTGQIRIYPLVDLFPSDKLDVLDFWEQQTFTLQLKDYQGNCKCCFKKSDKKLQQIYRDNSRHFNIFAYLENQYGHVGGNRIAGELSAEPRKLFRGYRNTRQLIASFNFSEPVPVDDPESTEGCASSCEAFMGDIDPPAWGMEDNEL